MASIPEDVERQYTHDKQEAEHRYYAALENARHLPATVRQHAIEKADEQLAMDYGEAWRRAVGAHIDDEHGSSGAGGPL